MDNREIKFRGMNLKTGEWCFGYLLKKGEKAYILDDKCVSDICCIPYTALTEVSPKTVGQYIGLTDKDGKKIYEGDIVFFRYDNPRSPRIYTGFVRYDKCNPCFVIEEITHRGNPKIDYDFLICGKVELTVISDLLSNPNILNK